MARIEDPNWDEIEALLPSYGITKAKEVRQIKRTLEKVMQSDAKLRGIPDLIGRALGGSRFDEAVDYVKQQLTTVAPDIGVFTQIVDLGRGDTRAPKTISDAGGFYGWSRGMVTLSHAKEIVEKVGQMTLSQQKSWVSSWKYPTPSPTEANPWVATGVGGAQKGMYRYTMGVPLIFQAKGSKRMVVGTDTGSLDTASVIGVKLYMGDKADEVLLLTGIPKKYINHCNEHALGDDEWANWDEAMGLSYTG